MSVDALVPYVDSLVPYIGLAAALSFILALRWMSAVPTLSAPSQFCVTLSNLD